MALNQWFKFYGGEYLSDPKVASLTPQERSCWLTLLCLASISSTPGTIEYLTIDALLQKSGIMWDPYTPDEWDNAKTVLDKFVRVKMITKADDGTIEILNWGKRQETNLTNAERQARFRGKSKEVTQAVTKVTLDKNRIDKNIHTSEASASGTVPSSEVPETYTVDVDGDGVPMPKSRAKPDKLPEAEIRAVFNLFGRDAYRLLGKRKAEREAISGLLEAKGIQAIKGAMNFYADYKDEKFCPQISSPYKLASEWDALSRFKKKNGL